MTAISARRVDGIVRTWRIEYRTWRLKMLRKGQQQPMSVCPRYPSSRYIAFNDNLDVLLLPYCLIDWRISTEPYQISVLRQQ